MSVQRDGRHTVVDKSSGPHPGKALVTTQCFCGAQQGKDYERYCYHLEEHTPEDLDLGGDLL